MLGQVWFLLLCDFWFCFGFGLVLLLSLLVWCDLGVGCDLLGFRDFLGLRILGWQLYFGFVFDGFTFDIEVSGFA